jgi:thymidine phosphorylase
MDMRQVKELIQKKRDGLELETAEIEALVAGVSNGRVSDAQIAAFTMATWFRGMSLREQTALTFAMRDSGTVLRWPDLGGPVLDKHSTGGVGDLVSLVLGPVVAACGGYVPMISGRGLGHTGGTLDKLESIPGFNGELGIERFQKLVLDSGLAIVGQTSELVPADRRIYAVRDVTGTVASTPLIVSSILSKKLAEGLDALVMDIKYGCGAFMADVDAARKLGQQICRVAGMAGLACNALVTHMAQPLASCAGNALEVREAIRLLHGEARNRRLLDVVLALCAELLQLGGLAADLEEGRAAAGAAIDSGRAAERFARMVRGQGGPGNLLDKPDAHLPSAPLCRPVTAEGQGFVTAIDTTAVGMVVVQLGGGRHHAEDPVDPSVGLSELAALGQHIEAGVPIGFIHAASEADWQHAANALQRAYRLGAEPPAAEPVVACRVEGESVNATA